jgi:hypothetical protein
MWEEKFERTMELNSIISSFPQVRFMCVSLLWSTYFLHFWFVFILISSFAFLVCACVNLFLRTFDLYFHQFTPSHFWLVFLSIYSLLSRCPCDNIFHPWYLVFHGSFKNFWSFPSLHLYRLRSMQGASKSSLTVNTHIDTC